MNTQLNAILLDSLMADHIRAAAEARGLPEYRSQRSPIKRRRHREVR
jgi:hypothetical protein